VFKADLLGFVGMSYITFKAMQVYLEVHDGVITKMSPLDYLYFLLFFAPFISGPIDRSRRFIADANTVYGRQAYLGMVSRGVMYMLVGAVYKICIATLFYLFEMSTMTPGLILPYNFVIPAYLLNPVTQCVSYGLYLFFDFAGYSLMAIGAGLIFGINVPRNFKAPFISINIKDFWNRWHITLSYWLRDFVFMRFERTAIRHKWFHTRLTNACVGYLVNMTLMGCWHGLTLSYVGYGIYHGLLLALNEVWEKKSPIYKHHKNARWYKCCTWAVTMVAVFFGFALFDGQVFKGL
jgi:membrane protein involved in D-alanine export